MQETLSLTLIRPHTHTHTLLSTLVFPTRTSRISCIERVTNDELLKRVDKRRISFKTTSERRCRTIKLVYNPDQRNDLEGRTESVMPTQEYVGKIKQRKCVVIKRMSLERNNCNPSTSELRSRREMDHWRRQDIPRELCLLYTSRCV